MAIAALTYMRQLAAPVPHCCCMHMLQLPLLLAVQLSVPPGHVATAGSRPTCGPLLSIVCTNSPDTHTRTEYDTHIHMREYVPIRESK